MSIPLTRKGPPKFGQLTHNLGDKSSRQIFSERKRRRDPVMMSWKQSQTTMDQVPRASGLSSRRGSGPPYTPSSRDVRVLCPTEMVRTSLQPLVTSMGTRPTKTPSLTVYINWTSLFLESESPVPLWSHVSPYLSRDEEIDARSVSLSSDYVLLV